jgi:hypothetical protein
MSNPLWMNTIVSAQGSGAALTASTTPTNILPTSAIATLPNLFFNATSSRIRIFAAGIISTVVTTPGTLTFSVRFTAGSTVIVATSDALALNIVAKSSVNWRLHWDLRAQTLGSGTSTTLAHNGVWISEAVIGSPLPSVGGVGVLPLNAAGNQVGTGFDGTAAQQVGLFATWSLNNADSITLTDYTLEGIM